MAPNSDSKQPPDRAGGTSSWTPSSKPRVLSPELAKALSRNPSSSPSSLSPSPSSANTANTAPSPTTATTTTTTSSSSSPSSLFSRFRAHYSALPAPVRRTFRALRILAPVIPIGIFFSEHVLQVMWVRGPSMTPYLNEDYAQMQTTSDMVLVNMWPWGSRRRLERGMVVTFRSPANPSHVAIKRVIALPGDRVITREPCLRPSQIVPFNHVWLEGDADDPRKSLDSNTYGPVSISLITGKVIAVLWPKMRLLKWWEWDKSGSNNNKNNYTITNGVGAGYEDGKANNKDAAAGGGDGSPEGYRSSVRERVLKEAVKIERPSLD